ncbi:actin-related protein 5-like, partial [Elysia marginata]
EKMSANNDIPSNVYSFKDEKTIPDTFYDYPASLTDDKVPLVIDNGTYQCRADWATHEDPRLVFKNLVAKQRGKRNQNEVETLIGNDITNVEVVKWVLRSQFDRNIVTLFDIQEQVFDYVFSHLGINTEGSVNHPIVLTEALCNPNYNRQCTTNSGLSNLFCLKCLMSKANELHVGNPVCFFVQKKPFKGLFFPFSSIFLISKS